MALLYCLYINFPQLYSSSKQAIITYFILTNIIITINQNISLHQSQSQPSVETTTGKPLLIR